MPSQNLHRREYTGFREAGKGIRAEEQVPSDSLNMAVSSQKAS